MSRRITEQILELVGGTRGEVLGSGGEATVYAVDDDRVVRILHQAEDPVMTARRKTLLGELAQSSAPFALPEILAVGELDGSHYSIERRLRGVSVLDQLVSADGANRRRLIEAHLDAAAAIGDLHLEPRDWFGELIREPALRTTTWHEYLVQRTSMSLEQAPGFENIDAAQLADQLPTTDTGDLLHLDAFAGNMLTDGSQITAVIDFSATAARGDRRIEPLSAAVYFCAPEITPVATEADRSVVMAWLRNESLDQWYEPARRWLAAFWAWAIDDVALHQWCRRVLLP